MRRTTRCGVTRMAAVSRPFTGADGSGNGVIGPEDCGVWKSHFGEILLRSEPAPSGDYNLDQIVNAADYTVWRNMVGTSRLTPYSGADGSGNGSIGPEDCRDLEVRSMESR